MVEVRKFALDIFLDEIERRLRTPSSGAGRTRAGAVPFNHRAGASLNQHTHFDVCVIEGVFAPDAERGARFVAVPNIDPDNAQVVQARVRHHILRAFQRQGILDKHDRTEKELWKHGGGFSLDATVRIAASDRRGLELLLRYCAIPSCPQSLLLDSNLPFAWRPGASPYGRQRM
jgi:hypothetical protein